MESRFESDLAELSGNGSVLLACAERRMLFHEGEVTEKRPLGEVVGLRVAAGEVLVALEGGGLLRCRFAAASQEELEDAVRRFDACVKAWR